jgi:hypothetical protein
MSLAIQAEDVIEVLLHDRWYDVKPGTFDIDIYEFSGTLSGGHEKLLPVVGAAWVSPDGTRLYCPITSVLAVRMDAQAEPQAK